MLHCSYLISDIEMRYSGRFFFGNKYVGLVLTLNVCVRSFFGHDKTHSCLGRSKETSLHSDF